MRQFEQLARDLGAKAINKADANWLKLQGKSPREAAELLFGDKPLTRRFGPIPAHVKRETIAALLRAGRPDLVNAFIQTR
jgi:hypothetical protein